MPKLFVYGTLLDPEGGFDSTIKAELYTVVGRDFPTIVNVGETDADCYGQVYEVSDQDVEQADWYEGYYPHDKRESLYLRIETVDSRGDKVYVYTLAPKYRSKMLGRKIPGGKWDGKMITMKPVIGNRFKECRRPNTQA